MRLTFPTDINYCSLQRRPFNVHETSAHEVIEQPGSLEPHNEQCERAGIKSLALGCYRALVMMGELLCTSQGICHWEIRHPPCPTEMSQNYYIGSSPGYTSSPCLPQAHPHTEQGRLPNSLLIPIVPLPRT